MDMPQEPLRELALFAGAGDGLLGSRLLRWKTVCAVEIDPYRQAVLLARQADGCLDTFPIWDDVRTFDGTLWRGKVDIVTGGFPCQDISTAGKGAGIEGERSGLWSEQARIIGEVRPRFALVENSPALTLRGLGRVLGDLAAMGFDAKWGVLGACQCGAPHTRDRMFIIANRDKIGWDENGRYNYKKHDIQIGSQWKTTKDIAQWRDILRWIKQTVENGDWNESSSEVYGMADGTSEWMDRIAACGDMQVPAVVRLAWMILHDQIQPKGE